MPTFSTIRCGLLCLTVVAAAAALGDKTARCNEPSAIGVVVLRNGNVLEGAVRLAGGYYVVDRLGASLQVPVEQVEMACGSLGEAYELRRRARVGGSADANLELARWCLRHNLFDQAAREILDARTRDPGHPALAGLEVQLRQAIEVHAGRRTQVEAKQAAAAVASETAVLPPPPVSATPSAEAQTQFVRSIQPMLVNGCATGGCHQSGSPQRMQLDRWALEGNGNPLLIRRNLDAVLGQIDVDDPASSPLLVRARQVHGERRNGLSKPLATYRSALLLEWLNEVAGIEPAPLAEAVGPDPAGQYDSSSDLEASIGHGNMARTHKPRDTFDAEVFNRMMAARSAAADAVTDGGAGEGASAPLSEAEAVTALTASE